MNELALFAGAGGGILGGRLLGWRTVCAVEFDAYARDVLVARQNDGCLEAFPIWDDVRTFDGRPWRGTVDVVSGGFPCQDISIAGKGAGIDGERSGLWKEFARIIGEVRPQYVLVENSPILTIRGLNVVLGALAALGFDARWGVLGACDAGAPHKRDRIWIVGHGWAPGRADHGEDDGAVAGADGEYAGAVADADCLREPQLQGDEQKKRRRSGNRCLEVAHSDDDGCGGILRVAGQGADGPQFRADSSRQGVGEGRTRASRKATADAECAGFGELRRASAGGTEYAAAECGGWWESEPDVGRVADGVAARVDRLRCIGNGQVPGVAALAWRMLTEGGGA